jgi:predicted  nucleic acid-binding Zn-ribbon protein
MNNDIKNLYDLISHMQTQIDVLNDKIERQDQELVLLRNDFETVKNEGCWLSKQTATHLGGDHKHE